MLTLVPLLASAVRPEALAQHPLVLLGAACFIVGRFLDLLVGGALWVLLCTVTGLSLILVGAVASARTARESS